MERTQNYLSDGELIIAIVAPVGIDLDPVVRRFSEHLSQLEYITRLIRVSQLIDKYNPPVQSPECSPDKPNEENRIVDAMNRGNELRKRAERSDILALLAIKQINEARSYEGSTPSPLLRHAHIIRTLKHPDEAETLRQVYGPGFILVGVTSEIETRRKRLIQDVGLSDDSAERLITRDEDEGTRGGQRTRDVFQMADAFITVDSLQFSLSDQIKRLIDILFCSPTITPTPEEYSMFMAYAASLRSGDLSRQVGAVLTNEDNDIIATGANDVPKYKGGLYWPGEADQRDHVRGLDSNEERRNEIILNVMRSFKPSRPDGSDESMLREGKELLSNTGILDLTEYGRAVHAEMESLMCAARNGQSTRGAILYTTTYPCHNCAKHIVAAGIKRVIYIEPYPKSLALKLHDDSIHADCNGCDDKVDFQPFLGIGPRRFVDLFSMTLSSGRKLKRKQDGKLRAWSRSRNENLRVPLVPISYLELETALRVQAEAALADPDS